MAQRRTKGGPGSGHFGHRGRPGIRGGSAPSTVEGYFQTLEGIHVARYMDPWEEAAVSETFRKYNVPPSHLDRLDAVMARIPQEYFPREEWPEIWDDPADYPSPEGSEWDEELDEVLIGFYTRTGKQIGLSPRFLTSHVPTHELGHHVVQVRFAEPQGVDWISDGPWGKEFLRYLHNEYDKGGPESLTRYGISPLALHNTSELAADSYLSWMLNQPSHRENLYDAWLGSGFEPEEIFKP